MQICTKHAYPCIPSQNLYLCIAFRKNGNSTHCGTRILFDRASLCYIQIRTTSSIRIRTSNRLRIPSMTAQLSHSTSSPRSGLPMTTGSSSSPTSVTGFLFLSTVILTSCVNPTRTPPIRSSVIAMNGTHPTTRITSSHGHGSDRHPLDGKWIISTVTDRTAVYPTSDSYLSGSTIGMGDTSPNCVTKV